MFDKILDRAKRETQKQAVELVLKNMQKMISEDVVKQVQNKVGFDLSQDNESNPEEEDVNYTERLFLSNSKDLTRLIVNYNMDFFYPQLEGDKYIETIKWNNGNESNREKSAELKNQIYKWQEQRLNRVQKVFDEYNMQGWNSQQTLEGINSSLNSDDEESAA